MAKVEDKNGFWFIEHNPITKTGVYDYLGKQISPECEPNKIYKVLRPKEELFKKETLDSLRLIPIVNDHTMIGTGFTAPEDKGIDGTLGDNVSHDTDTIYNDLKIMSNSMKEDIRNGKKELSLGYFCRYDKQPGTYKGQRYDYIQRDIKANHLALVDKGRMGADVRVYDSQNQGGVFAMDSIDVTFDREFNESDVNRDKNGRFATKGSSFNSTEKYGQAKHKDYENELNKLKSTEGIETKEIAQGGEKATAFYKDGKHIATANHTKREIYRNDENPFERTLRETGFQRDDNNYSYSKEYKDGTVVSVHSEKNDDAGKYYVAAIADDKGYREQNFYYMDIDSVFNILNEKFENKKETTGGDMALDDEDIEWITVKGTHIPIKKGESKEQAVKKFLEGKKGGESKGESESGVNKEKLAKIKDLLDKTGGNYEFAKTQIKSDEEADKMIGNLEQEVKKQEEKMNAPEKVLPKGFEKGDIMHSKKIGKNYVYLGKNKDGLYIFADNDKFIKNDLSDDDMWLVSEKYLKNNLADGNMTLAENRSGYEKSEPEKSESGSGSKIPDNAVYLNAKKRLDNLIKGDANKEKAMKELVKIKKSIPKNNYAGREEADRKIAKKYKLDEQDVIKMYTFAETVYGQDSTDTKEYKKTQGEDSMAENKQEKPVLDEDKRKIIDEIGGILKGKVDEELWRTVIGKAEKLAYNASEAGKGTDEGEEVEEVIEEKEEKAGKDCGKKAAKDKCGKDKDEEEVEEKEDVVNKVVEKKGMDENDVIKVIARKDRLARAVAKVIGTFDHSEMTEQQVAEYACDKLDLPVKKGEEITGINCYLKSLPKERVIFSYGMDSASKEDAEFEKFQKGE